MKRVIASLLVAAVASLLAVGHSALAHDATEHIGNSHTVPDCDHIVTVVSRSDYLICDDRLSYFANEDNADDFARGLGGDKNMRLTAFRMAAADFKENDTKCRDHAAKRRTKLENGVGAFCKSEVRRLKAPGGCKDQGKEIRILYHQHRKKCDNCKPSYEYWDDVHATVDCD